MDAVNKTSPKAKSPSPNYVVQLGVVQNHVTSFILKLNDTMLKTSVVSFMLFKNKV